MKSEFNKETQTLVMERGLTLPKAWSSDTQLLCWGGHGCVELGVCVCFGPGAAYTCLEAATGRALLRQHMDVSGEENPLNKLRVKIEPGPEGSSVFPPPVNYAWSPQVSPSLVSECFL